jgi:hypothetical protein
LALRLPQLEREISVVQCIPAFKSPPQKSEPENHASMDVIHVYVRPFNQFATS